MLTRRVVLSSPLVLATLPQFAEAADDIILPLDMSGPRPAIRVQIADGPEELWVFDTGAGGGVIDIERARALGLPELRPARVGSPAGGTPVEGFMTTIGGARVGDIMLPEFSAVAMPFPGHVGAGVLSPNMFAGRLVTLDIANATVRVHDREGEAPTDATPYDGARPLPSIPVSVAGQAFSAHLDTGAPGTLIFPYALANSLPLAAPPEQTGVARLIDGERLRYAAVLTAPVQVGPLAIENPQIDLVDGLPNVNVGAQVLRRMVVTLDPERHLSWARLNG